MHSQEKKTKNPIKNMGRRNVRHFLEEDRQMANRHKKKMFLIIYHYQNPNQIRDLTPVKMKYQSSRNNLCWQRCNEKLDLMTLQECCLVQFL